jgi:hypothetical protein
LIPFVKDVGRKLSVGDTPPAQGSQAPAAPPGPEAQHAAALMRLVEQMGLTIEHLGIQVEGGAGHTDEHD